MSDSQIPTVTIAKGVSIPQVGLGLWKNKEEQVCKGSIKAALESGYRHFDTAQIYGNEQFVGAALKDSGIPRQEIFITTKIWNGNQSPDKFGPSLESSLKRLQTDYVDLLLIHFPVTGTRQEAWRLMEEVHKSGKARSVGVSNYTIRHLEELLDNSSLKPAVNQVELHVYLQQPELVDFCRKHDIAIEAYSPLAHGHGLGETELKKIAAKHNKSTAQIMLRWCVEQGFVILPKSTHANRIKENAEVFDFKLDDEDKKLLKGLDSNYRTCWDPTEVD